jgi:CBS domain-containing protein
MQGGANLGVLSGNLGNQDAVTRSRSTVSRRKRSPAMASREALNGTDQVLIVDDFHYIDQATQLAIVRGLKDLIFGGLGVILAAVPHRAYDAVRVEKEMTGRVTQLSVGFWGLEDLASIAQSGFAALNVRDPLNLRDRLAREAFQSPHLMQDFCRALCKANGVESTQDVPFDLQEPDWNDFFVSRAPDTSKAAFDLLARGPRQRTDRKPRSLASGVDTDIYGAVLRAIAHTGPLTSITYETLRAALKEIMSSEPPQRHEVTRVLEEMAKIAREQIEGEPVVDYDDQLATLFISDPYFAYWLRWGSHRTE